MSETPFLDALYELLQPRIPSPPRGVWINGGEMLICPKCARQKEFRKDEQEPALYNNSSFNCEVMECQRLIECDYYHDQGDRYLHEDIDAWIDNAPEWRHCKGEEAYRLSVLLEQEWQGEDVRDRLEILAEAILSTRGQRKKARAA